jgi:hypothetical protein
LIKKTVRLDSVRLQGGGTKMFLKVYVSKAAKGVFYLAGIPTWDPLKQVLFLDSMDYHIESKQWLMKSASYLLDGVIKQKLQQYSTFNFSEKLIGLTSSLATQMNRTIYTGISSRGYINKFSIDKMEAADTGIFIQGAAEGKLWLDINAAALLKNFL